MLKPFFTALLIFSTVVDFGQCPIESPVNLFSISQIDSICNSIDADPGYPTVLGCGDIIASRWRYSKTDERELVQKSETIFMTEQGVNYSKSFYYHDHKLIKAIMGITRLSFEKIYEACYYFSDDKLLKVKGETTKHYTAAEIINCAAKNCICVQAM